MVQSHRPVGPTLRSQWLGQSLKQLRGLSKIGIVEASDFLDMSTSTMSRIENAFIPIKRGDLKELLTFYKADPALREQLLYLRDVAWRRDWWDGTPGRGQENAFADYVWLESRARAIRAYESMGIYGLFQTRDYASALIEGSTTGLASETQMDEWVDLRLRRQSILTAPNAPDLDVILDEAVLRRMVGGAEVMAGQLAHLVQMAARDRITVRVVPFKSARHPGYCGAFAHFTLDEPYPEVAYAETPVSRMFVEAEDRLERLDRIYNGLLRAALSPDESVEFIAAVSKELE